MGSGWGVGEGAGLGVGEVWGGGKGAVRGTSNLGTWRTHQKQILQAVDHRLNGEDGHPLVTQDVEAHSAFQVDVGVVDLIGALDLGWLVRVVLLDLERKVKRPAFVHAWGSERGRVSAALRGGGGRPMPTHLRQAGLSA